MQALNNHKTNKHMNKKQTSGYNILAKLITNTALTSLESHGKTKENNNSKNRSIYLPTRFLALIFC